MLLWIQTKIIMIVYSPHRVSQSWCFKRSVKCDIFELPDCWSEDLSSWYLHASLVQCTRPSQGNNRLLKIYCQYWYLGNANNGKNTFIYFDDVQSRTSIASTFFKWCCIAVWWSTCSQCLKNNQLMPVLSPPNILFSSLHHTLQFGQTDV